MEKIDLKDKLILEDSDLTAPNIVVEKIVSQIKNETNGVITGNIESYDGPVLSYTTMGLRAVLDMTERKVDIQDSLGKRGEKENKYEFYLTTPVFEQYQYRVCFLQYGVANYPVKVVLEQSIANEINKKGMQSNYIYVCNNPSELEELIISVIYSKKVIGVMQELVHIHQIHRNDEMQDVED